MAEPGEREIGERSRRGHGREVRLVALVVVVAAVVAFVVQNGQAVTVKFWFVNSHPRLIWVIGGCVVIGVLLGLVLGRADRGRRQAKRAK